MRAAAAPAPVVAREIYSEHCASCHGRDGKAQTRLGRKSGAKDLTDKKAMARLTDEDIAKTIRLGRKNAQGEELMEPFGRTLSEPQIAALVPLVRSYSQ